MVGVTILVEKDPVNNPMNFDRKCAYRGDVV